MKKILFVANSNQITDELNSMLSMQYNVSVSNYKADTIIGMIDVLDPDLVFISLIGASDLDTSVFSAINLQHPQLPIITLGDEIETKRIARYSNLPQLSSLLRPISTPEIINTVSEKLSKNKTVAAPVSAPDTSDILFDEIEDLTKPKKKTILVVDDNAVILRNLKLILEVYYNVNVVTSGIKAVTMLEKKRPDLILLDYEMPVVDGRKTLEMIRAEKEFKDIPVIFLTSINDREQIQAVLALNPNGYLLKPPVQEKLLATIERIIGR